MEIEIPAAKLETTANILASTCSASNIHEEEHGMMPLEIVIGGCSSGENEHSVNDVLTNNEDLDSNAAAAAAIPLVPYQQTHDACFEEFIANGPIPDKFSGLPMLQKDDEELLKAAEEAKISSNALDYTYRKRIAKHISSHIFPKVKFASKEVIRAKVLANTLEAIQMSDVQATLYDEYVLREIAHKMTEKRNYVIMEIKKLWHGMCACNESLLVLQCSLIVCIVFDPACLPVIVCFCCCCCRASKDS